MEKIPEVPAIKFQYIYPHSFPTIASAFLRKFNYETYTNCLTTISDVEQTEPNKFSFYRKVEYSSVDGFSYEKVTIDRESKEISSELVRPLHDKILVMEKGIIKPQDTDKSVHDHIIYDDQCVKTWKLDQFKTGVERVLKTLQFLKWDEETQ